VAPEVPKRNAEQITFGTNQEQGIAMAPDGRVDYLDRKASELDLDSRRGWRAR